MNTKVILSSLVAICFAAVTVSAEIVKTQIHYDIAQSIGKNKDPNLVTLFCKERDGSITYISIYSKKLISYLNSITSPTVTLTIEIEYGKEHNILKFIKLDDIEWDSLKENGRIWIGKLPESTID